MGRVSRRPQHPGLHRDDGVTIVLVALLLTAIFTMGALAVDISTQVNQRQELQDTVDVAAHAAAYELSGAAPDILSAAQGSIAANDPSLDAGSVAVEPLCVVPSEDAGTAPADGAIPANCTPDEPAPPATFQYEDLCDEHICALPCDPTTLENCNAVRVTADKDVYYQFAPVIGQDSGTTGSLSAIACAGSCVEIGKVATDVVFAIDRTSDADSLPHMVDQVTGVLDVLQPDLQRVALATIAEAGALITAPVQQPVSCGYPKNKNSQRFSIPVPLSESFGVSSPMRETLACLRSGGSGSAAGYVEVDYATVIGDSAAALNPDPPDLHNGLQPRAILVVLATGPPTGPSRSACQAAVNATDQARNVDGVLVVTVFYGPTAGARCVNDTGPYANVLFTDVLASMAASNGIPGPASNDCAPATAGAENTDGDHFFCAMDLPHLQQVHDGLATIIASSGSGGGPDTGTAGITLLKPPG